MARITLSGRRGRRWLARIGGHVARIDKTMARISKTVARISKTVARIGEFVARIGSSVPNRAETAATVGQRLGASPCAGRPPRCACKSPRFGMGARRFTPGASRFGLGARPCAMKSSPCAPVRRGSPRAHARNTPGQSQVLRCGLMCGRNTPVHARPVPVCGQTVAVRAGDVFDHTVVRFWEHPREALPSKTCVGAQKTPRSSPFTAHGSRFTIHTNPLNTEVTEPTEFDPTNPSVISVLKSSDPKALERSSPTHLRP